MVKQISIHSVGGHAAPQSQRQMERDLVRAIVIGQATRRDDREREHRGLIPQNNAYGFPSDSLYYATHNHHTAHRAYLEGEPRRNAYRPQSSALEGVYQENSRRYMEYSDFVPPSYSREQLETYETRYHHSHEYETIDKPHPARGYPDFQVQHRPHSCGGGESFKENPAYAEPTERHLTSHEPVASFHDRKVSYYDDVRHQLPKIPLRPSVASNQTYREETRPPKTSGTPVREKKHHEDQSAGVNLFKSPVTRCFEQMLGAAEYLASNPTPDHAKNHLESQQEPSSYSSPKKNGDSIKRKSDDTEASVDGEKEKQPNAKRARNYRPFFTTTEQVQKLNKTDPGNPFVQLVNDEHLYYRIILLMTLEAENKEPKKPADSNTSVSKIIMEGFYWRDYPELESLLYRNMDSYYSVSVSNRQSRVQQNFNNHMVSTIRSTAEAAGYSFDSGFTDKRLRDRIRCFYKTHLQNAKKRLATMQKNPNSVLNQTQLRLWIEEAKEQMKVSSENGKSAKGLVENYRRALTE